MTASLHKGVQNLAREYPEWQPWLVVIEEVMREATDPKWQALVPPHLEIQQGKAPLLAGVTLALDAGKVRRWQQHLLRTACGSGAPKMPSLESVQNAGMNKAALFEAALCENSARLKQIATDVGVDADGFQAVAVLLPIPFLHACNRRWHDSDSSAWTEGYCPTCGAWPAFAEVRGIERHRFLRCGRCGSEWQSHSLLCPYCGNTDHKELASLLPEKSGSARAIDTCKRCLGYIKTFTTLQGSPAARIILDDLASVDLDLAALAEGYKRPAGPGYVLDNKLITTRGLSDRIFHWNA